MKNGNDWAQHFAEAAVYICAMLCGTFLLVRGCDELNCPPVCMKGTPNE